MASLADRQAEFARAVLDDTTDCPAGLAVPSGTHVRERFAVYRNNVAVGLIEALRGSFPVVERLVGSDFFRAMARTYARQELPSTPVLLAYGGGFPGFISGFPPLIAVPYISDVARLEWAWVCAFHADDATPISIEALKAFPGDRLPALRLVLHPSVSVLWSGHPAFSIWRIHQDGSEPLMAGVDYRSEAALVWRDDVEVQVARIGAGAFGFLKTLQDGGPLHAAGQSALDAEPDLDLPGLIQGMFQRGIFIDAIDDAHVVALSESIE